MAKEILNKKFLIPIFVVIVVVAIFAVGIGGNYLTGPAAVKRAASITQDVTGTVWTCVFENKYYWKHVYEDETIETIDGYINPETINCDDSKDANGKYLYWYCSSEIEDKNSCYLENEGETCTCEKQKTVTEQMPAGG